MIKKIILIFSFIFLFSGCTNSSMMNSPKETVVANSLSVLSGELVTKYIENDINYMEIRSENSVYKLNSDEVEDFELLIDGQIITLEYDENNKVKNIISIEDPEVSNNINEEEEELDNVNLDEEEKFIHFENNIDLESLNEYYFVDVSGFIEGNKVKSVGVYTDAQKNSNGEFMWDDGNYFKVIALEESGGYVLFDDRIQIGSLNVNVFFQNDILNISILDYATAHIRHRVFEQNDNLFIERTHYNNMENINMIGSI